MEKLFAKIGMLIVVLLLAQSVSAEVVRLKSGAQIRGSIVFQNDQVLVIKKADGSRFQYMQTDIAEVLKDEEAPEEKVEEKPQEKAKKVTASLQIAGGMASLPGNAAGSDKELGANVQADLIIGTANLLDKRILVGGGLGYHMNYLGGTAYSFLPIQARVEAPLMQTKHAPMLGVGVGYGISVTKSVKGGAFADLSIGWRYQMNEKRALSLSLFGNFQQATLSNHTDIVDGAGYVSEAAGRAFVNCGIRFAVYL